MQKKGSAGEPRLWTSQYILSMLIAFVMAICYNMQTSTLPLFTLKIGGSKSVAGLMIGLFAIAALIFRPLFGYGLDKKGRKIILLIGIAIFSFISLTYNFIYAVLPLCIFRFIQGVGFSGYTTASGTIFADIVPPARLMEGIGYSGIANTLATAVGPAIALAIVGALDYRILFILVFVLSVTGLLLSLLINYEKDRKVVKLPQNNEDGCTEKAKTSGKREALSIMTSVFEKSAVTPSVVMFFAAFAQGSIITFIPSFGASLKIAGIGTFFTVYAMALLLTRPTSGRLSDRYGVTKIIVPGMILLIISFIWIGESSSLPFLLVGAVFYGLGFGTVSPVLNALTIKMCPVERRGAGNAVFFSSVDAGYGLGSIAWGVVAQYLGFRAIYFLASACVALSFALYFCLFRRRA